jgi:chemotaxis protein methyltransferase CheR
MNASSVRFALPWDSAALDAAIAVMIGMHGLDVSCYDRGFLGRTIELRREVLSDKTPAVYLDRLKEERAEAVALLHSLRVTYSGFFRDPLAFAVLERVVLPSLASGRRSDIRIWCAGCASGQEAWSVAILLDELSQRGDLPSAYRIFATDISERDLASAKAGVYSADALRDVRWKHVDACFTRQGDGFDVVQRIRERVEFSHFDLLNRRTALPPESIYGEFDLVMCCNVLLYYHAQSQRIILNKLRRGLAAGGFLTTGEAERPIAERAGFRAVAPPAGVFQKTR